MLHKEFQISFVVSWNWIV